MTRSRYGLLSASAVGLFLMVASGCTSNGSGVNLQTLTSSSPANVSSTSAQATAGISTPTSTSPTSEPALSPVPHPTTSSSKSVTSSSPASSRTSAADQEAVDRQAIASLWPKFLAVAQTLAPLPESQRAERLSPYAVNPALQQALATAANFAKNGWVGYGAESIVHRMTWKTPISGKNTAVMSDCMDDYNYGSKDAKTGKKLTGGVHRDNTQVTLVRRANGSWAVSKIEFLVKVPC